MAIIKIDKNIKLEDVESCYNEFHDYIDKQLNVDLHLPKILEHNYFGLIPALYQFAVTWVRYSKSGKLLLDIDNINETDLDKLYENELLFPLISLVWNKNEVYTKDGLTNLRTILRPKNVEMFEKMKKVKSLKGSKLLLTTFDHLPEDRGVLPCFEINHEFIKNEFVLTSNLRPSLTEILNFSIETKSNYEIVGKHLMGIVYELMKNTYEWAREDESRVPLDPSVRGLLIRFFKKRRKSLLEDFQKHKGLTDYFESNLLKENSQSELYFLEVSVLIVELDLLTNSNHSILQKL